MVSIKPIKLNYDQAQFLRRAAANEDGEIAVGNYGMSEGEKNFYGRLLASGLLRRSTNRHVDLDNYTSWYMITDAGRKAIASQNPYPKLTPHQLAMLREAAIGSEIIRPERKPSTYNPFPAPSVPREAGWLVIPNGEGRRWRTANLLEKRDLLKGYSSPPGRSSVYDQHWQITKTGIDLLAALDKGTIERTVELDEDGTRETI